MKFEALVVFSIAAIYAVSFVGSASSSSLIIDPRGTEFERPIGQSFILTCRPNVEDPSLIIDLKWLGPDNQTVREEPDRKFVRQMPGETKIQLVFRELRENDTGIYSCHAFYASNNPLLTSVVLKSYLPITWVDAPEEQFATRGEENEMITCVVKASPAATVSWSKGGQSIATGLTDVRFAVQQGGLRISEVRDEDEGIYTCSADVVSTGEYKVRQIRFKVYSRPEFIKAPTNAKGVEGEPMRIECRARGRPSPTYTWLSKDNANLGQKEGYTVDKEGTLNIDALKRDDEGPLTCVAENPAKNGRVEKTIDLAVIVKPRIEEFFNKSRPVGSRAELSCRAVGNPPPVVEFRKLSKNEPFVTNGVQLSDSRISIEQNRQDGFTVGVLSITDVLRSDDGLYGCTAKNDGGEAYVNGHLEVQFPPTFASMPNLDVYYSWDENPVNLSCVAESIPNATIRWFFGSGMFEAYKNRQLTVFGEGPRSVLQVMPIDTSHYTSYTCRAQNLLGEADYTMKLIEAYPPERIQQAIVVEKESSADMVTFRFIGPREILGLEVDAYLVQYRRHHEPWSDAKRKIWTRGTPYVLEDLEPRETYVFRFAARNGVGTGDWAADMTHTMPEEGPPFQPVVENAPISDGIDFIQSPYSDRFELRWQVPPANGRPIDAFEVAYYKVVRDQSSGLWTADGPKHSKIRPYPGASLVMPISGLLADSLYKVEVRARNAVGLSHPGVTVFKTQHSSSSGSGSGSISNENSQVSTNDGDEVGANAAVIGVLVAVGFFLLVTLVVVDAFWCRNRERGFIHFVSKTLSSTSTPTSSPQGDEEEAKGLSAEESHEDKKSPGNEENAEESSNPLI